MACVSKIGSLYELVTKNVVVTTTNTIFGINPRIWLSLPCEGLLLLKIRQVVPTTGETLPVQIAVPANSTVSTVGDDTCCPVTGVAVVNPINVAVTGAAMVNKACDSILEEINPAFKQTKDQDRKIKNLEEKVDRMGSSFDELKELLIKKLG